MENFTHNLNHDSGNDMDSSYSSASSPGFPTSPASVRSSATFEGSMSSPSRHTFSLQYGSSSVAMTLTAPPAFIGQDYVHVPSPITQGYMHVSPDIAQGCAHLSLQSSNGHPTIPQYRDSCPAPAYFPLHNSLPEFPTSSHFVLADHGNPFRGTESPQAMSTWAYDGNTPVFDSPSPVSMFPHTSMSPPDSPSALVQSRQTARFSPNGSARNWRVQRTRGNGARRPRRVATTVDGIECEVIEARRHYCEFQGCGLSYARPEHLKRHQKIHDEKAEILICEMCLDLEPPEKVHRVKNRLDNFVNHVKNHTRKDQTNARTKWHPRANVYWLSLVARQKAKGRGKKAEPTCKLEAA